MGKPGRSVRVRDAITTASSGTAGMPPDHTSPTHTCAKCGKHGREHAANPFRCRPEASHQVWSASGRPSGRMSAHDRTMDPQVCWTHAPPASQQTCLPDRSTGGPSAVSPVRPLTCPGVRHPGIWSPATQGRPARARRPGEIRNDRAPGQMPGKGRFPEAIHLPGRQEHARRQCCGTNSGPRACSPTGRRALVDPAGLGT